MKKQCEKHPEATMIPVEILGEIRNYRCIDCEKEMEEAYKQKQERERNERIKTKLDMANIPKRLKEKSLENFITTTENQKKVKKIAIDFIENYHPDNSIAGLILIGNTCTGKSHIACAILQEMITRYEIEGEVIEITKLFRARKEQERESHLLLELKLLDLLVLEINIININDLTQYQSQFIKEIISDRYNTQKPTIIVSTFNIPELRCLLGDGILEKFKGGGGKVLIFDWESYFSNTKKNII